MRFRSILEVVATIALTSTAILLTFMIVRGQFYRPEGESSGRLDELKGELQRLTGTPAVAFNLETVNGDTIEFPLRDNRRSLLVFVRSDCVYCRASTPLWKELQARSCEVRFVVVSVEDMATTREYWETYGWPGHDGCAPLVGRAIEPSVFREHWLAHVTPTIYVLGVDARIEDVALGLLSRDQVQRLIQRAGC